jgi:hypothetical protein
MRTNTPAEEMVLRNLKELNGLSKSKNFTKYLRFLKFAKMHPQDCVP